MNYIPTLVINAIKKLFYAFGLFFLFVFWTADGRAQSLDQSFVGLAPNPIANFVEAQVNGVNGVAGLSGISDVAVSPDGKFVYTASYASSAVSVFERNLLTGKLTYRSTITDIVNAFSVAVSPDNKSVYVASPGGLVYGYNRDQATGALTLINSANGSPTSGFISVSISNDGKWVYGVGGNPSGVVVFGRDMDTGALTLIQDLADNIDGYELGQYFGPVTSPIKNIATSADGQYVYIAATVDNAVTVFAVNEITGQLTQQQVVKDGEAGADGIQGASSLILSPNGRFLYVSGQGESSIALFSVDQSDGMLVYIGKVTNGVDGVSNLVGARSLAMSPDGRYLFVSAITSDAVSSFECDSATGLLTLVSVAINSVDGVSRLDGPSGIVTDRFSRHLYVAGQLAHSLVVFALHVPAVELPVSELTVPYNRDAILLASLLNVYDADSEDLASATITIEEGWVDTDLLTVELQGSISGTYDNTTGTLSLTGIAPLVQYQDVLRTLSFKLGEDVQVLAGSYSTRAISITVSDGENTSGAARVEIRIERPLNSAPVITGTPATSVDQDMAYSFVSTADDIDGDALTYSIVNKPDWADFDVASGELFGTPGNGDVGITTDIVISVSDGTLEANLPAFNLEVVNVNDAPVITGTPATSVDQDMAYSFVPTADDIDGDALTYSIVNKPDWADFDVASGELFGTPSNGDVGITTDIVISVSDGTLEANLPAFNLEVVNVNNAPTITGTPVTSLRRGEIYSFVPSAVDIDGDQLTFGILNKPNWANFNTATGVLTGTSLRDSEGLYSGIVISVSDGIVSVALPAFDIEVAPAPAITGITFDDGSFVYDGTAKSLAISGTLPIGASVSYAHNSRTIAGTQTVTATINGGNNYNDLVLKAELRIQKAKATITADAVQNHIFNGSVKNVVASLNHSEIALTYSAQQGYSEAATYKIEVSANETENYEATSKTVSLVIGQADFSGLSFNDKTITYDGKPQTLALVGTPENSKIDYTHNGQTDAGTYRVIAKVTHPNYTAQTITATLVITKMKQQITFDNIGTVTRDANRVPLKAISSSGLTVSIKSDDQMVATVEGGDLLIHRLGTVRLTASQEGDKNHEAAEPVFITVHVGDEEEGPVKVHQAFSPNGDGINDLLIIEGIKDYPENRLQVMSRNGLMVFDMEGYDNEAKAFRGISNTRVSSNTLPEGTYFYVLKYKDGGIWRDKKGWFVLKL